jgi:hypothetical protein
MHNRAKDDHDMGVHGLWFFLIRTRVVPAPTGQPTITDPELPGNKNITAVNAAAAATS